MLISLNKVREEKQLTWRELSAKTGLAEQYLRQIAIGRANPTLKAIEAISKALRVQVSDWIVIELESEND